VRIEEPTITALNTLALVLFGSGLLQSWGS
jgi:hypothetical protein